MLVPTGTNPILNVLHRPWIDRRSCGQPLTRSTSSYSPFHSCCLDSPVAFLSLFKSSLCSASPPHFRALSDDFLETSPLSSPSLRHSLNTSSTRQEQQQQARPQATQRFLFHCCSVYACVACARGCCGSGRDGARRSLAGARRVCCCLSVCVRQCVCSRASLSFAHLASLGALVASPPRRCSHTKQRAHARPLSDTRAAGGSVAYCALHLHER